ncbi:MAG: alginate export family protein [Wenzhouxiangellaceae bacterium]|nr:alginate export family protein [Wenzhouxiangellaceae bacterium]
MNRDRFNLLPIAVAASLAASSPLFAQSLVEALAGGQTGLDLRYRTEVVDEDGFDADAEASTLRTRLNYRSGAWRGLTAFVELADVREVILDDFNAGAGSTPGRSRFPVVADPEDTRLNQAWLAFAPSQQLTLRGGRQRIKLDNDRFVGNVGWRQNEQTYDGGSLEWNDGRWNLFYSYVAQVNRIFDSDVPAGQHDHDTHLLNASLVLNPGHQLAAYFYRIEDEDQQVLSNRSIGIRYTGKAQIRAETSLDWLLEFAHQSETGNAPVDIDASYFHARLRLNLNPYLQPAAGFERLEGSRRAGAAFRTPLATLHAFNGWADRFLVTPAAGLDDAYLQLTGSQGRLAWKVSWHHFSTETGSTTLGNEWDGSLNISLHETTSLLLKAAYFDDNDGSVRGVAKFWTMLSFRLP